MNHAALRTRLNRVSMTLPKLVVHLVCPRRRGAPLVPSPERLSVPRMPVSEEEEEEEV